MKAALVLLSRCLGSGRLRGCHEPAANSRPGGLVTSGFYHDQSIKSAQSPKYWLDNRLAHDRRLGRVSKPCPCFRSMPPQQSTRKRRALSDWSTVFKLEARCFLPECVLLVFVIEQTMSTSARVQVALVCKGTMQCAFQTTLSTTLLGNRCSHFCEWRDSICLRPRCTSARSSRLTAPRSRLQNSRAPVTSLPLGGVYI